jgi:hypothetical protein
MRVGLMQQNEVIVEKEKISGVLNIPRLFEAEALSLQEAVERGKLLHSTKNIRDSGGPLEARFRSLLADRMPEGVQVKTGYAYDIESNCTPQIDAMLINGSDNHTMMTTEEGAVYAPFTSVLTTIEIKSSVGNVAKQLIQTNNIVRDIKKMGGDLLKRRPGYDRRKIVSVLFYATSKGAKLADFKEWYVKNPNDMPTYVVFLDRGCILAGQNFIHDLLTWDEPQPLKFQDHDNAASYHLWTPPDNSIHKSGKTLLWLYYAFLNIVDRFNGQLAIPDPNGGHSLDGKKFAPSYATAFIHDAVERYALYSKGALTMLDDWPVVAGKMPVTND